MYAQKFNVQVVIRGQAKPCPLEWLDQFCMRNFTNAAEFDDTLPVAEGKIESSFRLTPERFAEGLAAWLTQRGKGEGQPVVVQVTSDPAAPAAQKNPDRHAIICSAEICTLPLTTIICPDFAWGAAPFEFKGAVFDFEFSSDRQNLTHAKNSSYMSFRTRRLSQAGEESAV